MVIVYKIIRKDVNNEYGYVYINLGQQDIKKDANTV